MIADSLSFLDVFLHGIACMKWDEVMQLKLKIPGIGYRGSENSVAWVHMIGQAARK